MGNKAKNFPASPVVHLGKVLDVIKVHGFVVVEDLHDTWKSFPNILCTKSYAGVKEVP